MSSGRTRECAARPRAPAVHVGPSFYFVSRRRSALLLPSHHSSSLTYRNGAFGQRQKIGEDTYTGLKEYATIPENTPGIRVSAVTNDGAFVDQVQVFNTATAKQSLRSLWGGDSRTIFQNMKFGENNDKGWCVSTEPNDTFGDRCEGGQAHLCVDFCVGGNVHVCTGHDLSKCVAGEGLTLGALEESS